MPKGHIMPINSNTTMSLFVVKIKTSKTTTVPLRVCVLGGGTNIRSAGLGLLGSVARPRHDTRLWSTEDGFVPSEGVSAKARGRKGNGSCRNELGTEQCVCVGGGGLLRRGHAATRQGACGSTARPGPATGTVWLEESHRQQLVHGSLSLFL